MKLPKGASAAVDAAAKEFIAKHGVGKPAQGRQDAFPDRVARSRSARAAEERMAAAEFGERGSGRGVNPQMTQIFAERENQDSVFPYSVLARASFTADSGAQDFPHILSA